LCPRGLRVSKGLQTGSFTFPRYLQYLLTDFRQTFVTGASRDRDDLITFLGQKVKVQGHAIAAEAHSTASSATSFSLDKQMSRKGDGCCIVRCRKPESVQEMQNWNLQFSQNLLTISARHLQPEMIYQTASKQNGVRVLHCIITPRVLEHSSSCCCSNPNEGTLLCISIYAVSVDVLTHAVDLHKTASR